MSQAGPLTSTGGGGSIPSSVPEVFTTDLVDLTIPAAPAALGSVVAQSNVLRVFGGNAIVTTQTGNAGDLFISFLQRTGVTNDVGSPTPTTFQAIITVPLNVTMTFQVIVSALADNNTGVGAFGSCVVKNIGGTAVLIGDLDLIVHKELPLANVSITASVSGSTMIINCTGVIGRNISWTVCYPGICAAPD